METVVYIKERNWNIRFVFKTFDLIYGQYKWEIMPNITYIYKTKEKQMQNTQSFCTLEIYV